MCRKRSEAEPDAVDPGMALWYAIESQCRPVTDSVDEYPCYTHGRKDLLMGAWDAGSFQNDTALDWAGNLNESGDIAEVRTALVRVLEERPSERTSFIGRILGRRTTESYLGARVASEGLAAAEIVAFWLGHPDQHFPDYLQEFASPHFNSLSPELIALARQAVLTIKTKSELKALWEEGDGIVAPKWHAAIADLERRLQDSNT